MAFSPQVPSFAFPPPRTPSKYAPCAPVEASPAVHPVKQDSPAPLGTFTCKDPGEKAAFEPSLLKLAQDYQSDDADYLIWSSDVICFKVHSYRLQAASSYFRDAIKQPKTATSISLAKLGFCDALVVKNLLDIVYTSEPTGCQNIELAYRVITLATYWNCDAVLKILRKDLAIQALVNSTEGTSNDHLRLAFKLQDHHLMALIAQRDRIPGRRLGATVAWGPDSTGLYKFHEAAATGLAGSSEGIVTPVFELGGLSYAEFLKMPPTVLWALARSTYLARTDYGAVDVDEMANYFEDLLNMAYPNDTPQASANKTEGKPERPAEPANTIPLPNKPFTPPQTPLIPAGRGAPVGKQSPK